MSRRPNFYELLGLPLSVEDWPTIERAIKGQKAKWNKDASQGHAAARRKAQLCQSMLVDIQSVMSDPQARRAEAEQAKRRVAQELGRWVALLKAEGSYAPDAVERIAKSLRGLLSVDEVLGAIRAAGIPRASIPPSERSLERTSAAIMTLVRANLQLLGITDLYAFLELSPTSSPQRLQARATEIWQGLVRNGRTDAACNAKKELAGYCLALFRSPEEKEKYDIALECESMLQLGELLEWAGRDGHLSQDVQDALVEQCRNLGVSAERARLHVVGYANDRKWKLQRSGADDAQRERDRSGGADATAVMPSFQRRWVGAQRGFAAAFAAWERARECWAGWRLARQAPRAAWARQESAARVRDGEGRQPAGDPRERRQGSATPPAAFEIAIQQRSAPSTQRLGRSKRVYGIDLGATHSCISYVDEDGKPLVVASSEGQQTTPSVVFFESGQNVVVGQPAKNVASIYADRVVSTIKRSMGVAGVTRTFHGKEYTPPEISSFILRKLAQDAETATGEKVEDVVITCPAHFGVVEREATKQAGEIAGFNVLQVIAEPIAAVIAHPIGHDEDQTVLVCDLGGSSFGLTLIATEAGNPSILATLGHCQLGGKDWDDAIVLWLAEAFEAETGTLHQELLDDAETYQELLIIAEQAKIALSQAKSTPCRVVFGSSRVRVDVTREKFDEITASYLQRAASLTQEMIDRAREIGVSIDRMLLVGGSTSMSQVREWASTLPFEVQQFEPSQAVAKGAALFGVHAMVAAHCECQRCSTRFGRASVDAAELLADKCAHTAKAPNWSSS